MHSSLKAVSILTLIINSTICYSQAPSDPTIFYSNIVDIGKGDFALITGDDIDNIYFVCVKNSNEDIDSEIGSIKFYNSSFTSTAKKVNAFKFGSYNVVLYMCQKSKGYMWQKRYYNSASLTSNLSTFLDNGESDSLWSINRNEVSVIEILKDGLLNVRVKASSDIDKGMPIISNDGFIVGIFAEKSEEDMKFITAINIKDIAKKLYDFADCKYFNMIEYGQNFNRCELEKRKKHFEENNEKYKISASKNHFVDFGISGSFMGGLSKQSSSTDEGSKVGLFTIGLPFYLNIDKMGYNRLTITPRYGKFTEGYNAGIWVSPSKDFKITGSNYKFIEVPITFEREIDRSKDYSMSLGLGYAPGYVFNHTYNFTNSTTNSSGYRDIYGTRNKTYHRLLAEVNFFEWEIIRLGLSVSRDISKYPNNDYEISINNLKYTPFSSHDKFWFFGVDLGIRLRGYWGLRQK